MTQKATKRRVEQATQRSLERALREERLALAAIVKVFLLETPEPSRVLARLDAMVRAAEANPRTSAAIRRQLLDATRFVRTAIERETGKPQTLFDPHVGHVRPDDVNALVEPTDGEQQLGLINHGSTLGDVEDAHEDRVQTITQIHEAIVTLIRDDGAATDQQLLARYQRARMLGQELPPQSALGLRDRRRELVQVGRLTKSGSDSGTPRWDLVERAA